MIWCQLTQTSAVSDTSWDSLVLGVTAVLFAVVARLPARLPVGAGLSRTPVRSAEP